MTNLNDVAREFADTLNRDGFQGVTVYALYRATSQLESLCDRAYLEVHADFVFGELDLPYIDWAYEADFYEEMLKRLLELCGPGVEVTFRHGCNEFELLRK